jgi:hypothetical protein
MDGEHFERAFDSLTPSQRAEAELQTAQFVAHLTKRGIHAASGNLPVVLEDGVRVLTPYSVYIPSEDQPASNQL